MIYSIIFLLLSALSYWFWRAKFIPAEVARNAAAITANGSQDNLQQGYHSRETWRRIWPGLACCVVPSLSFSFSNLTSFLLSFLAMAALLAGCFARYFTPLLNLAMRLDYKPEWYASPASKAGPTRPCGRKCAPSTPNQWRTRWATTNNILPMPPYANYSPAPGSGAE